MHPLVGIGQVPHVPGQQILHTMIGGRREQRIPFQGPWHDPLVDEQAGEIEHFLSDGKKGDSSRQG